MMSKKDIFELSISGLCLILLLAALVGYILNIVEIAQNFNEITGIMVVRIIGIFLAPIGVILGYI